MISPQSLLQKYENACICHFDRRGKSFGSGEFKTSLSVAGDRETTFARASLMLHKPAVESGVKPL